MKEEEREELSKRSNSLRLELKVWEKEFASANNGQKASRDDIKKNPEIGIFLLVRNNGSRANITLSPKIQRLQQNSGYTIWKNKLGTSTRDISKTQA
jgi:hypothetical protein